MCCKKMPSGVMFFIKKIVDICICYTIESDEDFYEFMRAI